jgi:hypothetical protein
MSSFEQFKTTIERFRVMLGVPSALVVLVFFIVTLLGEMFTDAVSSTHARFLVLGVLTLGATALVLQWDRKARRARVGSTDHAKLGDRKGLVIILGLDSDSTESAAAKLLARTPKAEYVALVTTPREPGGRDVVTGVVTRLMPAAGLVLDDAHVQVWDRGHHESVADFKEATLQAIAWMKGHGLDSDDIVVDISAGRRPMGFGAMLAADEVLVECQYLAAEWDHTQNAPRAGREAFKVLQER